MSYISQKNSRIFPKLSNTRGYTLLFAVLLATVIISVAISILSIGRKEVLLSGDARESMIAIFAADTGMECAMYYEDAQVFGDGGLIDAGTVSQPQIICSGITQTITGVADRPMDPDDYKNSYTFSIGSVAPNDTWCTEVKVVKSIVYDPDARIKTTIESRGYNRGYNTTNKTCSVSHPRKVERALRLSY